jgi:hypothetical protein
MPGRHLVRGAVFKTSLDEHGNHDSAGVERDAPWVAIGPVVAAIRVLERLVPAGELLFAHGLHGATSRRRTGSVPPPRSWDRGSRAS